MTRRARAVEDARRLDVHVSVGGNYVVDGSDSVAVVAEVVEIAKVDARHAVRA